MQNCAAFSLQILSSQQDSVGLTAHLVPHRYCCKGHPDQLVWSVERFCSWPLIAAATSKSSTFRRVSSAGKDGSLLI